jgi:hypothetical protein
MLTRSYRCKDLSDMINFGREDNPSFFMIFGKMKLGPKHKIVENLMKFLNY